ASTSASSSAAGWVSSTERTRKRRLASSSRTTARVSATKRPSRRPATGARRSRKGISRGSSTVSTLSTGTLDLRVRIALRWSSFLAESRGYDARRQAPSRACHPWRHHAEERLTMPDGFWRAVLDPNAPLPAGWPVGALGAFLLFCVPIGGGIPAGVLMARTAGVSPPVMAVLYFLS